MEDTQKKTRFSFITLRNYILGFVILSSVFGLGYYLGFENITVGFPQKGGVTVNRDLPPGKENLDFALFWQVWDTLSDKYFDTDQISERELIYGAISGMVSAVGDPYTVFLPPEQNKIIREDLGGSFEGVGIQIGFRDSQLAVIAPLVGSPAEESGVKAGDYIVGITDKEKEIERGTSGISLHEAVQIIRGQSGTIVTLTMVREGLGEPLEIDIKRAPIDVPTVTFDFIGEDESIAYIEINRFGRETGEEWDDAVTEVLKKRGVKGLIIDVRNNPGGYLDEAQNIASEFLEIGDTAVIEEHSDKSRVEYSVQRLGRFRTLPTIVIVNEGSASASEILAGALRDLRSIKLVGQTTFGKGTIQEPQELPNNAGLHITIARWLTPDGTWVNDGGLEPDILIEDDIDTEEDEQLQEALKLFQQ